MRPYNLFQRWRDRLGSLVDWAPNLRILWRLEPSFRHASLVSVCLIFISVLLITASAAGGGAATNAYGTPMRVTVVLELADTPVAQIYAALKTDGVQGAVLAAATQAHLAQVEAAQQRLLPTLETLGADVLFRNQRVYNGIALRIKEEALPHLARAPGVVGVHRTTPKEPLNSRSVPAIGAPALWQGVNGTGVTGAGVTIAIIDTGIDYLHTAFGGPGVGYGANDPTITGDVPGFPGVKVIGGYDFVGDAYNANPDQPTFNPIPAPDPDPMDCYPHGTGVAATAAGYGVQADGSTYSGPYNEDTDFDALKIGPGVAPHALLYALKVFGCTGSSEVVDQAIEWAVDPNGDGDLSDRVDVINLSLGSPYGAVGDLTTVAADNAVAAGVVVVAAAGNSGDTTYIVNAPSVGDGVVSVAAASDDVASFSARGPRRSDSALKPDLAAPGVGIFTAAHGTGSGGRSTSGTSLATPHVAGALALLRQRYPERGPAELKALLMNSAVAALGPAGADEAVAYSPVRLGAGRIDLVRAIDADVIAYDADRPGRVSLSFGTLEVLGRANAQRSLRIANLTGATLTRTLSYAGITHAPGITISLPVTTVIVPGHGLATAPVQLAADAGAMARSRDPTLAPTQAGAPRHWLSEESGYLLLWPPSPVFSLTVLGSDEPAASAHLSYEPLNRRLAYTISPATGITLTAVSLGRRAWGAPAPRLLYSDGSTAGQSISGVVTLDAFDEVRLASGQLVMTVSGSGLPEDGVSAPLIAHQPVIHIPLYAAPRPAAAMGATPARLDFGAMVSGTQPLSLTGLSLTGSRPPTDVVSLVSVAELHLASPRLSPQAGEIAQYGFADLQYVGVTSDLAATQSITRPAGDLSTANLYFAIAVYESWSTPNEVEFNIWIDRDGDGVDDLLVFNSNVAGRQNSRNTSDAFIAVVRDLRTGATHPNLPLNGIDPTRFDTALYNSRVMLLPAPAKALGLTGEQSRIFYRVESYSDDAPTGLDGKRQRIDHTDRLVYDVFRPALSVKAGGDPPPTWADREGATLAVSFSAPQFLGSGAQGILLLHHHNLSERQSEVIPIDSSWVWESFLPHVEAGRE